MLESLRPRVSTAAGEKYVPPFLESLAEATSLGRDTIAVVEGITKSLAFDNFTYGMIAAVKPSGEANANLFSTMLPSWIRRYDDQAYLEVDPRIERAWGRSVPLIWVQDAFRGASERYRTFLADALSHGIGSADYYM